MATIDELTTLVLQLQEMIDTIPTQEDLANLTALLTEQHEALVEQYEELEERVAALENTLITHVTV